MKKLFKRFANILLVAAIISGGTFTNPLPATAANPDKMEVHFIDVGQGDATLITCGGHAMLQFRIICKNAASRNWII